MSDWIPSQVGLRNHPKVRRLARTLDTPVPHVIGHLHCLWYWVLEYAPDGDLEDFEAEDLADAGGWTGDAEAFVDALVECGSKDRPGFLVRSGEGRLCVHDWEDNQGDQFRSRVQAAARKRAERARREKDAVTSGRDAVTVPRDAVTTSCDAVTVPCDLARAKDLTDKTDKTDKTGQDKTKTLERSSAGAAGAPDVLRLVDDFHRLCPSLPRLVKFEEPRRKRGRRLLNELGPDGVLDFFRRVEASDFLAGREKDWRADYDWVTKPEHVTKILEGNYDNRSSPTKAQANVNRALALVNHLEQEERQHDAR